jgi:hypothetical protein
MNYPTWRPNKVLFRTRVLMRMGACQGKRDKGDKDMGKHICFTLIIASIVCGLWMGGCVGAGRRRGIFRRLRIGGYSQTW